MSSQLAEISLLQMLESLEVWRVLRGLARLVLPAPGSGYLSHVTSYLK
ncbi:MAG: hypothetical protein QW335_06695 [Candidatus Nezhaarchaeales archaeon]